MMKNNNDFAIEKSGNVIQQMSQSKPRDEDDMSIAQEEPTKRISKGKMHLKRESIKDELENTELEDEGRINKTLELRPSFLKITRINHQYKNLAVQLKMKIFHEPSTLLNDAVKILEKMQFLTNENDDSKMFRYANSILLKYSSKKNVCCLLGCESKYINPYQNIIGEIQSDKRPIELCESLGHERTLRLRLQEKEEEGQIDGLRQPKQLQELIDGLKTYWEFKEEEFFWINHFSCNDSGDKKKIKARASLYKQLFVELVKILVFSEIINYPQIRANYFFEYFFGNTNNYCRCTSEYEYAEEIKKFINDSGFVAKEFFTWLENYNEKFPKNPYFHPFRDNRIKYLHNKIKVFNIKVRQSMDFFKDPEDIWIALTTLYYNKSQNFHNKPKTYTSEQIAEQAALMRENCQLYFIQNKEQKLEELQTQLINISGNIFYQNSYKVKEEFDGFPFFSSERKEQFIKNLK